MAGGFSGGAVVGRVDVMDMLTMKDAHWNATKRIPHQGTFNANPISAAAGLAQLKIINEGDVIETANKSGERLRELLNDTSVVEGSSAVVYGTFSGFHVYYNRENEITLNAISDGTVPFHVLKDGMPTSLVHEFRTCMLAEGVDLIPWPGGVISASHTDAELERTATAFKQALKQLEKAAVLA